MSIKEVTSNPTLQDKSCLVLLDKTHIDPPRHPRQPKISKIDLLIKEFRLFVEHQTKFNKNQTKFNKIILDRIDNLVKKNNLIE